MKKLTWKFYTNRIYSIDDMTICNYKINKTFWDIFKDFLSVPGLLFLQKKKKKQEKEKITVKENSSNGTRGSEVVVVNVLCSYISYCSRLYYVVWHIILN